MNNLILTAIFLRAGLLLFGSWQDTHLVVKYTDIDYEVYTDAAQFMVQGASPYQRSTYRYSPLLAALLTPNIVIHKSFGKILFAVADIIAALLMQRMLQRKYNNTNNKSRTTTRSVSSAAMAVQKKKSTIRSSTTITSLALALWLFSPFTVSISTRGNGEALVTCMLLAMLDLIENNFIITSGVIFGLAVHWRVYPIIYSLPILKYLATTRSGSGRKKKDSIVGVNRPRTRSSMSKSGTSGGGGGGKISKVSLTAAKNTLLTVLKTYIKSFFTSLWSIDGLKFGFSAAGVFLALAIGFYRLYGFQFLHETYLYHATRIDPRHNFSPYFYPAYLGTELGISSGSSATAASSSSSSSSSLISSSLIGFIGDSGKIWTLATVILQISLGWAFSDDLAAAFFLQTVAFVAFNKVATAQYFVWYFSWLPLVLPTLLQAPNKRRLGVVCLIWAASLGHWLAWAYQLEFAGNAVHLAVWGAGLLWVVANAALLRELIFALSSSPLKN